MLTRDYIEFDCSPIEETCVQVSSKEDYMPQMREQAKRMLSLLQKKFNKFPGYFSIKAQSHDFGTYLEIRYFFDADEEGYKSARAVETHYPLTWNDDEEVSWN